MYKDSVYNKMLESGNKTLHNGYDYRTQGITGRLFSNRMFQNPVMEGFIKLLEPYFVELLDSVKKLQFYQNYTIDKNDGSINK
jgi:hypothetical protein